MEKKIIVVRVGSVFQGTFVRQVITPANPRELDVETFNRFREYYGWKDPDDREAALALWVENREAIFGTPQESQSA